MEHACPKTRPAKTPAYGCPFRSCLRSYGYPFRTVQKVGVPSDRPWLSQTSPPEHACPKLGRVSFSGRAFRDVAVPSGLAVLAKCASALTLTRAAATLPGRPLRAWVAKLVDAPDSKSGRGDPVRVRVSPQAPNSLIHGFSDCVRYARGFGEHFGRQVSRPHRHRRPESASIDVRYPEGRGPPDGPSRRSHQGNSDGQDRLRTRSPRAMERGREGMPRKGRMVTDKVIPVVDLASSGALWESRQQVAFLCPTASLSRKRSRTPHQRRGQP